MLNLHLGPFFLLLLSVVLQAGDKGRAGRRGKGRQGAGCELRGLGSHFSPIFPMRKVGCGGTMDRGHADRVLPLLLSWLEGSSRNARKVLGFQEIATRCGQAHGRPLEPSSLCQEIGWCRSSGCPLLPPPPLTLVRPSGFWSFWVLPGFILIPAPWGTVSVSVSFRDQKPERSV